VNTVAVKAEEVEEGDTVIIDGIPLVVEELHENGRMNGVWFHCGGRSCFYGYGSLIKLVKEPTPQKKTITVMFSRPYTVEMEVEDGYDPEDVEERARDMVLDAEPLYSGKLEFDGIEENDE
jgi:hypothetical protein